MKKSSLVAVLFAGIVATVTSVAHAAIPDLQATLTGSIELANGFDQRITFAVQNVGAARAGTVTQTLRFSNQVTLLESPYWCPVTTQGPNKVITCSNSKLNAGARLTAAIRIRAPQTGSPNSSTNFVLTATTIGDTNTGNNVATLPMAFSSSFAPPVIQAPIDQAVMTGCSGSAAFDWSLCSSSSNQVHQIEFNALNQVLYQGTPVGVWSKPTARTLHIDFTDGNVVSATYNLDIVSTTCYRGIGSFPNSTWFAWKEICF